MVFLTCNLCLFLQDQEKDRKRKEEEDARAAERKEAEDLRAVEEMERREEQMKKMQRIDWALNMLPAEPEGFQLTISDGTKEFKRSFRPTSLLRVNLFTFIHFCWLN